MSSTPSRSTTYSYKKDTLPCNENNFNTVETSDTIGQPKIESPKTGFDFRDSFIAQQLEMRKAQSNQVESESAAKQPLEQILKDLDIVSKLKMGVKSAKSLFSKLSVGKLAGAAMMIGLAFGNVDTKENSAYAATGESTGVKTESVETQNQYRRKYFTSQYRKR